MTTKNTFYKWIGIGLFLRLIFMPISASPDILWFYWRAHLIVYHKQFILGSHQMLTNYIHAFFLWIFTPLMPYYETIWTHPWVNSHPTTQAGIQEMLSTFFTFVSQPHIFRTLFLLKLPFLLFDFGCLAFLWRLVEEPRRRLSVLKFWMVNPVSIFVVYIYGRMEVIPLFFILGAFYYTKKNRFPLAMIMLGISITTRLYPLLLFPFMVIILGKGIRERLKLTLWGLLPLGIMSIPPLIAGKPSELVILSGMPHINYLLSMKFNLGLNDNLYIFVVGYFFLLLHAYHQKRFSPYEGTLKYLLSMHLFLFAVSYFHRQFFMWTIPLIALYFIEDRRFLGLFVIQAFSYFVYTFYSGRLTAGYLFTPLNLNFFINLRSPMEVLSPFLNPLLLIAIFRSVFSATSLYMVYLIFKGAKRLEKKMDPSSHCYPGKLPQAL